MGTRTPRASGRRRHDYEWNVLTRVKNFNYCLVRCTFSTNGMPDKHNQVLGCFKDADLIEKEIRRLANDSSVDAVILTPHWGQAEYTQRVEPSQRALGRAF